MQKKPTFIFFGTPEFAVIILDQLKNAGFLPSLIITATDKPKDRHLILTPPPVKVWAIEHNIPTLQPEKITDEVVEKLRAENADIFIVAAYGKIFSQNH